MYDLPFFNMKHLHLSYKEAMELPALESLRYMAEHYEELSFLLQQLLGDGKNNTTKKRNMENLLTEIPDPSEWVKK